MRGAGVERSCVRHHFRPVRDDHDQEHRRARRDDVGVVKGRYE